MKLSLSFTSEMEPVHILNCIYLSDLELIKAASNVDKFCVDDL